MKTEQTSVKFELNYALEAIELANEWVDILCKDEGAGFQLLKLKKDRGIQLDTVEAREIIRKAKKEMFHLMMGQILGNINSTDPRQDRLMGILLDQLNK